MRYVTAEKDISTTHPKLGEIKIPANLIVFPQYDSQDEFNTAAGDVEKGLEWINGHAETDAKNIGRLALRNLPDDANLELAIPRICDAIKNYSPKGGERATTVNKKKGAVLDTISELAAQGKTITPELIAELMAKAL